MDFVIFGHNLQHPERILDLLWLPGPFEGEHKSQVLKESHLEGHSFTFNMFKLPPVGVTQGVMSL